MLGYWRILDSEYALSVIELLLLSAMEQDQSIDQLSFCDMRDSLLDHDIPETVLLHCLRIYSVSHEKRENGNLLQD